MNSKYTPETKQQIFAHLESCESVNSIAKNTGIPQSTIYSWIKTAKKDSESFELIKSSDYKTLQRQNERLKTIIKILKTVNCCVGSPLKDKLNELEKLYGQYSVHVLCDALDVPRGTFYNHIKRNKRDDTYYAKHREELRLKIQEIFDESRQIYGSDKILAVLQREGYRTSKKMVLELMRDMGLTSIRQDAKKMYGKEIRKCKNHINQNFNPDTPNQIWVSDVTYYKFNDKVLYICAIIDLYSRMVISYKIGKKNSTNLVKSTFKQAYETRNPQKLIFHTDRGSNYRSYTMCTYLKSLKVTQSFSSAHNPYDNSVMESFFSTMKREELYRTKYRSEQELRNGIDQYIAWYNTIRPHRAVGNKTPLEVETAFADK
ncbi:MAG: IS3 family transposase [Ruminococcaceae bacterium]|nr:IS3 family transposase [Oscillospiraceae bacterium]